MGSLWAMPKVDLFFFFFLPEITKADHQLSESFYLIKIYVLTELWIFQSWVMFSVKKVSLPAKLAVIRFWKFLNSRTWIVRIPISWKIYDFSFWPVFNASKIISGYLGVAAYVISRHISGYTFRILPVLYGYKLFLTSYVGICYLTGTHNHLVRK